MKAWAAGVAAAILLAAAAAAADPRADALYQAAVAKYGAADYQGAIKDAEAAVALDPQNWQAWQLDGNARYALGDKTGAVTVYRYSLQVNPNNPQLKAFVDSLAAPAQAAPAAAAAQVSPAQTSYEAALVRYNASDYDGAMQNAAAAVRADPNHWQAWQLLGNARYARADKRGALEAYDKSLALNPDNPQIRTFADSLRAEVAAAPSAAPSAVTPPVAEESPGPAGFVQRLSVRAWGGYGPVGSSGLMKEVNDDYDKGVREAAENGETVSVMRFSSLTQYGGEIGVDLVAGLTAGVIAGRLMVNEAGEDTSEHDVRSAPMRTYDSTYKSRINMAVTMLMVGGRYSREVSPNLLVRGGLFGGIGSMSGQVIGSSQDSWYGTWGSGSDRSAWRDALDGSGAAFQIVAGVEYRFSPHLGVALDLGYRSLKTDIYVSYQGDDDADGIYEHTEPREQYRDKDDRPEIVDFSGVFGALSVGYHF